MHMQIKQHIAVKNLEDASLYNRRKWIKQGQNYTNSIIQLRQIINQKTGFVDKASKLTFHLSKLHDLNYFVRWGDRST